MADAKYKTGDIVVHQLSGLKGQVLDVFYAGRFWYNYDGWCYRVRFCILQQTIPSHLLGSGGEVGQHIFATEELYEYELEPQGTNKTAGTGALP